LSYATAVTLYVPGPTFRHATMYGAAVAVAIVWPLATKSTWSIVPSGSDAFARSPQYPGLA
jgi:hypothetical protein